MRPTSIWGRSGAALEKTWIWSGFRALRSWGGRFSGVYVTTVSAQPLRQTARTSPQRRRRLRKINMACGLATLLPPTGPVFPARPRRQVRSGRHTPPCGRGLPVHVSDDARDVLVGNGRHARRGEGELHLRAVEVVRVLKIDLFMAHEGRAQEHARRD